MMMKDRIRLTFEPAKITPRWLVRLMMKWLKGCMTWHMPHDLLAHAELEKWLDDERNRTAGS